MKRRTKLAIGVASLAALLGAAAAVTQVYANAERLDVVDKKRSVAKIVTTVDRGAAMKVIATEGNWYKVDVDGKQGYVIASAVATSQSAVGKGGGVNLAQVKGGKIPELETAAAVKGLGDGTKQYAAAGRLHTDGLQEVIRRREAITPAEYDQFISAGGLKVAETPAASQTTLLADAK